MCDLNLTQAEGQSAKLLARILHNIKVIKIQEMQGIVAYSKRHK